MSIGEAYTLGVKLTGDITSLRAELAAGTQVVNTFASTSTAAMTQAAAAMERAAGVMERASERTSRSIPKTRKPLVSAAQGFDDYMRRATAAQEQVARTSESTSDRTSRSLGNVGSALTRLTGGLGFALLAKQVWDTGLGFATFTQNTEIALSTLLGSDVAARQFLATIMDFAKTTPYAFTDLTTQAQKLLSAGFDTEQIVPILTAVGDAATGMGKGVQGIDSITRALGQINTKGRLQSEELLQLSENGVNGLKILANQAGMSTIEYQKLITAGLIPADEAIAGLVEGIENGTTGVNGQTAAFTGLMEKIKGAGGITATVDSANTAFRNMSGALVDELTPAYLSLVRTATSGMGVIKGWANSFGELPGPIRDAALAFTALTVANRLLNTQARTDRFWDSYRTTMAASAATTELMGGRVTRLRTAMIAARSVAPTVGRAILGAFGGPAGLAVTGVALAVGSIASAAADARARAKELADTLDQVTGGVTDDTRSEVIDRLQEGTKGLFGLFSSNNSALDIADAYGINLGLVTDAALGSADAVAKLQEEIARVETPENSAQLAGLAKAVAGEAGTLDRALVIFEQRRRAEEQSRRAAASAAREEERLNRQRAAAGEAVATAAEHISYSIAGQGDAYAQAGAKVRQFTEDQEKAILAAGDAAFKAAQTNLGARSLNLATEDDIAAAREKVADATEKVSDAEADRDDKAARRKVSARDKAKAEEAVADARKALREATEDLAATEERADPVKQYREQVQGIIDASQSFVRDIQALADKGLNASDLASIIAAGPEGSADTRKALLSDDSLIGFTNDARGLIDAAAATAQQQAQIVQIALQDAGSGMGADIALGMRIAAEQGSVDTIEALAAKLGENPQIVYDVGTQLGLSLLAGMSDAADYSKARFRLFADGSFSTGPGAMKGMAAGGIYPGYTPGRDVGYIGISGGEAVMRPEWTRAVGPGYVHHMNAIARTAGVSGVQAEMRRYLGGFAGGGIPGSAPSVVTVPVSSTHERYSPVTVQKAYVVDARSLGIYGDRTTAQRNKFGGNRG